eukprot:CAMPEP_0197184888 /NCGR_PEP_ID=MMETSP1423-20130617/10785_1 /TAXON_ID=476441 /ORGANISM="Pseudo-nitzschia heimii, Strain UNC1101" /LENGTH=555 /DNA_ID=CAMNT_0042635825 /DNA_START=325 /DNA_END=1992 /DNA_ORIENTATION=+
MSDVNQGNDVSRGPGSGRGTSEETKRTASSCYNEEERKLRALAGQWKTPPVPIYASMKENRVQDQEIRQQQPHPTLPGGNDNARSEELVTTSSLQNLPDNSEEYAKALQEAYRKGAEAAARMAQHQQHIPSAASCPNFSTGASQQQKQPNSATPAAANNRITAHIDENAIATTSNAYQLNHQMHPIPRQQMKSTIPDPLSTSMPPPLPQSTGSAAIQHHHHPPQTQTQTQIAYAPQQQAFLQPQQSQQQYIVTSQQHQPQQMTTAPISQPVAAPSVAPRHPRSIKAAAPKQPQQQPGRSLSMPDMSSYAAEAEEEKRLKRLARNRASARLRRLRKKNLVDAYETEVGILEKTLNQLEAHEWGKDTDDHKSLLDALGMERGQQAISQEERNSIIQDILKQQMQQVHLLQQAQREQQILAMLASEAQEDDDEKKYSNNKQDTEMLSELQEILQLTDNQKGKLRDSSKGLRKEVEALETVSASLEAMQKNDWLLNEGVQKITDQFTSILHKNQHSKLLLWTDANAEAVDQLDVVQVQPLQNAPVFSFGVEATTPAEDE